MSGFCNPSETVKVFNGTIEPIFPSKVTSDPLPLNDTAFTIKSCVFAVLSSIVPKKVILGLSVYSAKIVLTVPLVLLSPMVTAPRYSCVANVVMFALIIILAPVTFKLYMLAVPGFAK